MQTTLAAWPKMPSFCPGESCPEIMPEEAYKGGAAVVGTGRSDLPNQINNVLGTRYFSRRPYVVDMPPNYTRMKIAAAMAIRSNHGRKYQPGDNGVPETLNMTVGPKVAKAVFKGSWPDRL